MKIAIYILSLLIVVNAQILELSEKVEIVTLESQHGQKHRLKKSGIWIVAWDKESTALVNSYFSTNKMREDLDLIVDTSAIPSGIFSLFVHPRMKKFKHTILFSFDRSFNLKLPYQEGFATLVYLEETKVTKIEFVKTQKDLKESLK